MTVVADAEDRVEPSGRGGMVAIDLRRRWIVITVATVVMQFAYWPTLAGIATASGEDSTFAGGMFALGLAVVPATFLVLAFGSNHPRAAGATLRAMGLFLLVALPVVVVLDGLVGMAAGLAAGGAAALDLDPDVHRRRWRWIAVAVMAAYLLLLRLVAVDYALLSGAVLPFAIHGLVDQAAETR